MLLAGGDLIESMGEPNVWADADLHHILGNYGCLIVERTGSDVRSFCYPMILCMNIEGIFLSSSNSSIMIFLPRKFVYLSDAPCLYNICYLIRSSGISKNIDYMWTKPNLLSKFLETKNDLPSGIASFFLSSFSLQFPIFPYRN